MSRQRAHDLQRGRGRVEQIDPRLIEPAMARLAADLESGAWARRNADLLEREEMDYGYRLVVSVD